MSLGAAGISGGDFPTGYSGSVCLSGSFDWTFIVSSAGDFGGTGGVSNVLNAGADTCIFPFLGQTFLCACYFSTSPTTNPTQTPTQNPTLRPTQNPTPYQKATRLVKLPKGSQVQVRGGVLYHGTPTLMEVLGSTPYQGVRWANVQWELMGVTQTPILSCNPIPNPIPGDNSTDVCPCLETNCTTTVPGPGLTFNSLRCCIISYEEELSAGGTSLPTEVWVSNATLGVVTEQQTTSFGTIRCNNPIERELNCQFWRQAPTTYQLQCAQSPITCYQNQTLGYAFGLFWDLNPNFPYTAEVLGEGQLRGIASILNNKIYSKNGVLTDPLDPKLLNDYYWIGAFTPPQQEAYPFRAIFTPDIIQSRPASWFNNLFTDGDLDYSSCLADPLSPTCQWLTWQNLTGPEFKLPGLWLIPTPNLTIYPQEWFIEGPGEGVEVYLNQTLLYQNLTRAPRWIIQLEQQLPLKFRILQQKQIWDIPAAQLSPSWALPADSLWSQVNLGNLQYPYLQLVSASLRGAQGNWPFLNESWVSPSLVVRFTLTPQRWDNLSALILEQNIYPFNTPLSLEEHLYQTRAVNLSNPEDQEYLRLIWSAHLARRHSSESGDCKTFGLGSITFYNPSDEFTQSWYQSAEENAIPRGGREGGCLCDPLFDPLLACGGCLEGLGGTDCTVVFGPDPVPGAPPQECAGHGQSTPTSTNQTQTLYLWNGKFTTCSALLFQGEIFELVGPAAQGVAFLFTWGQEELVYLRGELFYNQQPLQTMLIQEQPALWDTQEGLIECLGLFQKPFLMNAPYPIPPIKAQLSI
jgi:hypothetical protein